MTRRGGKATRYLRNGMVFLAFVLPALSLIPLGSLWLWEKGFLLYWVGAALVVAVSSYLMQLRLVGEPLKAAPSGTATLPDSSWSPSESDAWSAVEAIAQAVDPAQLNGQDAFMDLGLQTIEAVARSMHPTDPDPLWRFTVPEALALVERVSRELRPFITENIPLGDRLTISQVLRIYRWRSALGVAEKAYDIWRIVRLFNPINAVTNEARERLTKKIYSGLQDELAKRLAQGYVREVGRAVIDLYGGRLRVSEAELAAHVSDATKRDLATPDIAEPLRILVAGQISAGKSSLINALLQDVRSAVDVLPTTSGFTAYEVKNGSLPPILLVDSPGMSAEEAVTTQLMEEAGACDLLIWVVGANRADRGPDRKALDAIRAFFASRPTRRAPPVLVALTHIDVLRPYLEWSPSYDANARATEKAEEIEAVTKLIATDLAVPPELIVPVSLREDLPAYNILLVWSKISEMLPEATRAQLLRRLRGSVPGWSLRKILSQAVNAGKAATRALAKSANR